MVSQNETFKFKMPEYSSTFIGKLYALLESLNYILQNKKTARFAITDSNSKVIQKSVTYDFKTYVKSKVLTKWQNEWSNSGSKLIKIKLSINPWQYWLSSRKSQVILCRLRIGHTKTTHEYLISKSETPKCNKCQHRLSSV